MARHSLNLVEGWRRAIVWGVRGRVGEGRAALPFAALAILAQGAAFAGAAGMSATVLGYDEVWSEVGLALLSLVVMPSISLYAAGSFVSAGARLRNVLFWGPVVLLELLCGVGVLVASSRRLGGEGQLVIFLALYIGAAAIAGYGVTSIGCAILRRRVAPGG